MLDSKLGLLNEVARELRVHTDPPQVRDTAAEIEWAKVSQLRPQDYPAAAVAGRARNFESSRTNPRSPIGITAPACMGPQDPFRTTTQCPPFHVCMTA